MKNLPRIALFLIVAAANANASTIPLSTGYWNAGAHDSAAYGAAGAASDNGSQFLSASRSLLVDSHTLRLFELENCCDGGQQVQFKAAGNHPSSIAGTDGLVSEVSEPTIYAMLLIGLGLLGFTARHKQDDKF
ncbi:PEP-CTERM sorting domain-containing protein [Janthinobacterium sp. FW305-129]|uniref:PEP-CTERM sorting domain-containing protein n=1 Tax=Janthinobacterium sp. FW305-129 TaxID=2775054 RepID=UPI001E439008|nr:PEP-CTERM sorting domain-containing protein [Janthinobacterium sp. FW305-129]MCC7598917.1 PEP-CTERM sorting domain-containing protein [Janthinobacterium sp. FW305-129]